MLEANFQAFAAEVQKRYDSEVSMKCCAFGNNTWFAFWEGKIADGAPSAWNAQSKLVEFVDHIRVKRREKNRKQKESFKSKMGQGGRIQRMFLTCVCFTLFP